MAYDYSLLHGHIPDSVYNELASIKEIDGPLRMSRLDPERKGYIYRIVSPTGRVYIGQTVDVKGRARAYKRGDKGNSRKICRSIKKHGWSSHQFDIIDTVCIGIDKCILNIREQYWIKEYDSFINGLNCNIGGGSCIGNKWSEESKKTI